MGSGARYILRLGGAVDAVARQREADPGGADGVVRAGGKNQLIGDAFLLGGEGQDLGIKTLS